MESVIEHLAHLRIVPIAIFDDPAKAVPLARALLAGGCDTVEVSFRSPTAAASIADIVAEVPEMFVGAGSLLSVDDVSVAVSAGASFGIAPGFEPSVVKAASEAGLPFVPGFLTPSNVIQAFAYGCDVQEFFPAQGAGTPVLKALMAAFTHKPNFKVLASGGITPDNVRHWLAIPQLLACTTAWACPTEMIEAEDWAGITARTQELLAVAHQ